MRTLPQLSNLPKSSITGIKTYKRLNMDGTLAEQFEFINGQWIDVTEVEKAKEELVRLEEEIEHERDKAMKLAVKRASVKSVPSSVHCPSCGSFNIVTSPDTVSKYQCEDCRKRFSLSPKDCD